MARVHQGKQRFVSFFKGIDNVSAGVTDRYACIIKDEYEPKALIYFYKKLPNEYIDI